MTKTLYKTFNIRVIGKVQGVWYRKSTVSKALELELKGWVRNCSNGQVEIMAQGHLDNLEQLVIWCKIGPAQAVVENVEVTQVEHGEFMKFEVKGI